MRKTALALTAAAALTIVTATPASASTLTAGPQEQVSPTNSPFAGAGPKGAPCNGVPGSLQTGRNFPGTEVEPWVAVNPANTANLIAGWHQDRWSNGGANATLAGYTTNGGTSWQLATTQPAFTRCTGGTAANGGDYERASDPWVTVSPNGTAYYNSLAFDVAQDNNNSVVVSRSTDGGDTWGPTTTLRRDTSFNTLNDKNSITADPFSSNYVYAIWDRLEFPNDQAARQAGEHAIGYRGPTWFSRTTNGGASFEPARIIYDPGEVNQTIGNQIVVTGTGELVDGFDLIYNFKNAHKVRGYNVATLRSTDRGATWTPAATIVDRELSVGVTDPTYGSPVRTGDIIPEIAADPRTGHNEVYMVWQDARATGGARDQVAFAKSTDGGRTWTTVSLAINTVHSTQAFTPVIHVAADGTIGVLHYDFRHDDSGLPLVTSVWLLHSHDGGLTWSETKVGNDFDMTGGAQARGYFTGDYMGLTSEGATFTSVFGANTGPAADPPGSISSAPASNIYSSNVS